MDHDTFLKWVYYPGLVFILGIVLSVFAAGIYNANQYAEADTPLPSGVTRFIDGDPANPTVCYIYSAADVNITVSGVVGGISCVDK